MDIKQIKPFIKESLGVSLVVCPYYMGVINEKNPKRVLDLIELNRDRFMYSSENRDYEYASLAIASPFKLPMFLKAFPINEHVREIGWISAIRNIWDKYPERVNNEQWRLVFKALRESQLKRYFMSLEEANNYDELEREITVYRGCSITQPLSEQLSWSIEMQDAIFYKNKNESVHKKLSAVYSARVYKEDVFAFLSDVSGFEVLIDQPELLNEVTEIN